MRICSPYKPPIFVDFPCVGESITVQGLVTSLSVILNGGDDNNMKTLDLGYSENVRDLYPEMFGRPTKYELEYERQAAQAYAEEMHTTTDTAEPAAVPPSDAPAATPDAKEQNVFLRCFSLRHLEIGVAFFIAQPCIL